MRPIRKLEPVHGLVVVAEGVGQKLLQQQATLGGTPVTSDAGGKKPTDFAEDLKQYFGENLLNGSGKPVEIFVNHPRHYIRAGKASAHDQIYCERLGALAVDNALAGFTDFMISQWLTEFVLVPLELVVGRRKTIPPTGMFWKQVCSMTGQPDWSDTAYCGRLTETSAA